MKATEQDQAHLEEKAYLELVEFRELRELAPPHPRAWEVAQRKRTINEYLKEHIDLEELSDKLFEFQDIIETDLEIRSTKPPGQATGKKDHRSIALSRLFGLEASNRSDVVGFRSDVLEGQPITPDKIEKWVVDRSVMDGKRSNWVTLPLNDDGTLDWPRQLRDYSVSLRLLSYVDDPNQQIRHIPVRAGGTLDRLRRLSEHLAKVYGWRKAMATTFVLSDEVPPIPYVHYQIKEHSPWSKARRSVTITAPLWLTPKKMADLYQELRRTALRGEGFPRAVSEKTAELTVFAAQHNQGRTWWETMKLWNDQWGTANPKWEYEDEAQFTRDSREAFKRITGEHLHWDGRKE